MRKFIVAAATAAAFTLLGAIVLGPVLAADKGGSASEATLDQLIAGLPPAHGLYGCKVEASAAGNFLSIGERQATGAVGAGCDYKLAAQLFSGINFRADFVEQKSGEAQFKLGAEINPHLVVYPFVTWRWSDWQAFNVGQLHIGAGAETALGTGPFSVGVEASTAVAKAGRNVDDNDILVRGIVRYRIGQ